MNDLFNLIILAVVMTACSRIHEISKRNIRKCPMIRSTISRLLLLATLIFTFAYGQTDISGAISNSTTWDTSGSPYIIAGNTVIMDGITLTIDPGVYVLFSQDVYLRVLSGGTLIAQGAETDSIYFTLTDISTVTNTEGIEFASGALGSIVQNDTTYVSGSVIDYCVFNDFITTGNGAAISNACHLLISNSSFQGNEANYGGAIDLNVEISTTFNNVNFINNTAMEGGCVYSGHSWYNNTDGFKFYNCHVSNNTANAGAFLATHNGDLYFSDCNFENNTAISGNGGVLNLYVSPHSVTIENSRFINNSATNGNGGAINSYGDETYFQIDHSFFTNNTAVIGGAISKTEGGVWGAGSGVISNTIFSGNTATNFASAIHYLATGYGDYGFGSLSISSSIFYANSVGTSNTNRGSLIDTYTGNHDNIASGSYNSLNVPISLINNHFYGNEGQGTCLLYARHFEGSNNSFENNDVLTIAKYAPGSTNTYNFGNNYWGTKSSVTIDSLIFDFNDDPDFNTPTADYTPFLLAPSESLAGSPSTIASVSLKTDSTYLIPLSENINPGDALFIECTGLDSDPLSTGLSVVWAVNTMTQDTVTITLFESSNNSGLYRGVISTDVSTDNINDIIEGQDGQVLKIISRMNPSQQVVSIVGDTPLPILSDFNVLAEPDLTHALNHTPVFLWTYFDPLGTTQYSYQIQVSADSSFSSIDFWDSGVIMSSDTNVVYGGSELIDGTSYHARLQVLNTNSIPSNYSELTFRMNSIPGEPILLTPNDEAILADNTPTLFILNSSDSELDNLVYNFQLASDLSFVNILDSANNVVNGTDTTSWQLLTPLADNIQYWWRARANDGFENGDYSTPASFILNAENDDPASFDLTSPLLGEAIISQSPLFTWDPAVDPDPLDMVRYVLYLDTPDPGVDTFHTGIDTSFQLTYNLDDNTGYYWKVVAYDLIESEAESNGGFQSFIINQGNDSPSIVELITPDSVMVLTLTPEMYWTPAFDADPSDIVSYEMHWWGDGIEYDSVLTDTNAVFVTSELADNTQYFWEVIAMDQTDGISHSAEATFWTDLDPEAPGAFALLSPEDDVAGLSNTPSFQWELANDPDPMDFATYNLQIATDSSFSDIAFEASTDIDIAYELIDALPTDAEYWWRVVATDTDSLTTESETFKFTVGYVSIAADLALPTEFILDQNFPNPFNPSTTIRYGLPDDSEVSMVIYDIRGNTVRTIESGAQVAGWYEHVWNGMNDEGQPVSTGLYLTRLRAGSYTKTIKMLYLK